MPWVSQLPSGSWRAVYRDSARRRHSQTFKTKRAAEKWAQAREVEVENGVRYDPRGRKITLEQWWDRWSADRTVEASTRLTESSAWRLHVKPRFGDMPLTAILPSDVREWVKAMERGSFGPGIIRRSHILLSGMLKDAHRDGLIADNPAWGARLPALPQGREVYLSRDEVDLLTTHCEDARDAAGLVVYTLAYTGMRWSELAGLHVGRIDFLRKRLVVAGVHDRVTRKWRPYGKTEAAYRTLRLPERLAERLAAHLEAAGTPGRNEPVFTSPRGRYLDHSVWSKTVWRPTLLKLRTAKLLDQEPHVHDLRHTFASWLIQSGVPIEEIGKLLGHASPLTAYRYAHLAPELGERSLAVLEADPRESLRESRDGPRRGARGSGRKSK